MFTKTEGHGEFKEESLVCSVVRKCKSVITVQREHCKLYHEYKMVPSVELNLESSLYNLTKEWSNTQTTIIQSTQQVRRFETQLNKE